MEAFVLFVRCIVFTVMYLSLKIEIDIPMPRFFISQRRKHKSVTR